jgi:hypothetical protein
MDRFYKSAIDHLEKSEQQELANDIKNYVDYLLLSRSALVHQIHKDGSPNGKALLRSLGYKIEN